MDAATITTIIGLISGELGIDAAVARARDDQDAIDGLLRKRGGG